MKPTDHLPAPTVVLCLGTRPEIIKMAPVYHALRDAGFEPIVLHTGQHDELAWPLYAFFGMRPAEAIALKRDKPGLGHLSAELIAAISDRLEDIGPDAVLVHGDTTTALMAALAAFYLRIPVGHVEAGLRTHQHYDPFPEELNRQIIGRIATWHFAPTVAAQDNLEREGIVDQVHVTGNTAIDAARWGSRRLVSDPSLETDCATPDLGQIDRLPHGTRLLLVTAHRRENWGEGIREIGHAIRSWLEEHEDYAAVWPIHANPQVTKTVLGAFADPRLRLSGRLFLCPPVDYPILLALLSRCWLVLTDSGGIQEEAAAVDRPVLVLRDTTERPELIATGRGILVGARADTIRSHLQRLDRSVESHASMCSRPNPFGDGHAGERIAALLGRGLAGAVAVARTPRELAMPAVPTVTREPVLVAGTAKPEGAGHALPWMSDRATLANRVHPAPRILT